MESSKEVVEEELSINSVPLAIIDELVKQFASAADEVDRWNVETVVEVIKKAGKKLHKGKQVNVYKLSSIASSPLPEAQPRAHFSHAPSPIRNPFATSLRKTRITALMEAPPPPSKTGSTSRISKQVPDQESHTERNPNDKQTNKKIEGPVSQNEGLELNIESLKEEIGLKQVEIKERTKK
jgi:hypothetical protein